MELWTLLLICSWYSMIQYSVQSSQSSNLNFNCRLAWSLWIMMLLKVICYLNMWTSFQLNFLWLAFTKTSYMEQWCAYLNWCIWGVKGSAKCSIWDHLKVKEYTILKNLWWSFEISTRVDYWIKLVKWSTPKIVIILHKEIFSTAITEFIRPTINDSFY